MIAKQVKGCGFRGTLDYLLQKPEALVIGGNMLGETARELSAEFAESRKLRPNLGKAVYHASLSLAPGEHFSDEKWRGVAGHYVKEMGFEGSQYTVVRHKDTDHDHVHIVASRIRMDGTTVSDSQDYKRSEKVVRGMEIEHGLRRVPDSRDVMRRAPTGDEFRKMLRTDKPSTRVQLQGLVDKAIEGKPNVADFFKNLELMGVHAIPNVAKTGYVSGITYRLDNEMMKGSDLGKGYTWQGIQKRGVDYGRARNKEREDKAISKAVERGHDFALREGKGEGRTLQPCLRQDQIRGHSVRHGNDPSPAVGLDVGARSSKQTHHERNAGDDERLTTRATEVLRGVTKHDGAPSRGGKNPHMAGLGDSNLSRGAKRSR